MIILTTYYNPAKSKNRLENYHRFKDELGCKLLTLETAFGDEPFTLKDSVKLRGKHPLWMKERLIRIGERLLPKSQDIVIWLDHDILFQNKNWLKDTKKRLKEYNFIQPFETVHRRFKNWDIEGSWKSFGSQYYKGITSEKFDEHGHTGFAFACRRDKFDIYDRCVAGTFDHFQLHAAAGQFPHKCIEIAYAGKMKYQLYRWCSGYYNKIKGKISYVDGDIDHMWHGSIKNRQYLNRTVELSNMNFNPETDLYTNNDGLLETNRTDIQDWMKNYFLRRKEDDNE